MFICTARGLDMFICTARGATYCYLYCKGDKIFLSELQGGLVMFICTASIQVGSRLYS